MNIKDLYAIGGIRAVLLEGVGMLHRQYLRPVFPKCDLNPTYAGVEVPSADANVRIFDYTVPWTTDGRRPWHEHNLITAASDTISSGDDVIVVGGGTGAAAVHFSRVTGESGKVIIYEASPDQADICKKTIEANDSPSSVTIRNKVIEKAISLYGNEEPAETIPATELPTADVMVLDCEGAERVILESAAEFPDRLVVETHGTFNAPTAKIKQLLKNRGYQVTISGVEASSNDVYILIAER